MLNTNEFIDAGSKVDVVEVGGTWTQGNGFIEQTGKNKFLYAGEIVPAGDFTISTQLSLEVLNGTAASFDMGENRFGFDGRDSLFFTEGTDWGATQFHGSADDLITPGAPFELTVTRAGSEISFWIDGNLIVTKTLNSGSLSNVGFRPWRNTMRIYEFESEVFPVTSSNTPPRITSDGGEDTAALSVAEEQSAVTTVQATDPDVGDLLTYSISGGADAMLFNIDASTGELSFINAPDFETPVDASTDNIYEVQVQVDDGNGGLDSQDLGIAVTDIGFNSIYIDAGIKVDVIEVGGTWTQGNGYIEQTGTNKFLYAGEIVPAGDFTISAQLSLQELNHTAASFYIDGNHFGFDGNGNRFFTEGADWGAPEFHGSAANFIQPGDPFELTVTRAGSQISFSIDENLIVTETLNSGNLSTVGFRPWRNTMRIFEFEREGNAGTDIGNGGADIFFDQTTVFENGTDGYNTFRIPAIVRGDNGDLLAFAEGRVNSSSDFGNIDIVMKRSTDDGLTWGPLTVVVDNGNLTAGNASPVVLDDGKIVLVYNTGNASESDILKGIGVREVWAITSEDNGLTWSTPLNITTSVHKPSAPEIDPNYNFSEDWRWNAVGPGHAIQLDNGRLIFGANYRLEDKRARSYSFYSDDGGLTWRIGGEAGLPGNENQIVQLSNGDLLMNARPLATPETYRQVSYSSDAGESWTPFISDTELPDPGVHGSIISLDADGTDRLIFSNPASTRRRENLTVRVSYDDGDTWTYSKTVDPLSAAYSDLVIQKDKEIGLLYEDNDGTRSITYAQFNLAWLTDGGDFLSA